MSLLDDIYESTFLQVVGVICIFVIVMAWILQRRGKLPVSENLAGIHSASTTPVPSTVPVETPESRALLNKLKDAVVQLDPKLADLEFHEAYDTRIDNKQIVYLCLRDPATGKFYPWNALIYVTLHEMAHAISEGYDPQHTSIEFQSNFWRLLRKAEQAGIYQPSDAFIDEYCALPIDKNDPGIVIR